MSRFWLITGFVLYVLLTCIIFPFIIGVPWEFFFASDAIGYSTGAKNLLQMGFYTFDGIHPFMDREPIMSMFLTVLYGIFGVENGIAVALTQGIILFLSAWFFASRFAARAGMRAAGIAFILILTSGSVLHTVFSAYRECLVQSVLLLFAGLWLSDDRRFIKLFLMGTLIGILILSYYSFVFLPIFLLGAWLYEGRRLRECIIMFLIAGVLVSGWALRNASYDGVFRVIDNRRTAVMWYVRGEQAERIRGLEAFHCLWSEYISRSWEGRSDACSYNGLMHTRWPDGFDLQADYSDIASAGKQKILRYFPHYLWFSFFEVLELHAPYVGGGWGRSFNEFAAFTQLLLAVGFIIGFFPALRRFHTLLFALVLYNTAVFILTDATPRYLLPVFFCYAAIAGIGYDLLLKRLRLSP